MIWSPRCQNLELCSLFRFLVRKYFSLFLFVSSIISSFQVYEITDLFFLFSFHNPYRKSKWNWPSWVTYRDVYIYRHIHTIGRHTHKEFFLTIINYKNKLSILYSGGEERKTRWRLLVTPPWTPFLH
jgi:hypothetical protein